ncbi:MAG: DUF58 domain-containing protein [Pseudomonadota bacterium]
MIARLRDRVRRWWVARHPRTDSWTLTQRNIYIVPTRAGFVFAAVLMVMLLAAINYQLNLGYVLTFLLAGAGFVSMHLTHNTLRGLTLHLKPPQPGFAGEALPLEVVLNSPSRLQHGVGLGFDGVDRSHDVFVDVPAGGQSSAHLTLRPPQRGLHDVPTLRAETRYPFGLFRAWTVWRPAAQVLAWPAPERPLAPLPAAPAAAGDAAQRKASDSGEFEGVRAYRRGDALKRVVWKKAARNGELVSREASSALQQELWLDWQLAQLPGTEPRLSRLAAWVLAAEAAGVSHGLRLPGVEITPGSGSAQQRRSLDALALWS